MWIWDYIRTNLLKTYIMKKSITLGLFLAFCLFGTALSAQNYKSAIGLRLGYPWAFSYKTFINESHAIEATANFRTWGYLYYRYTRLGVAATYQVHNDLSSVAEGFQWYYGGGVGVGFYRYNYDDVFVGTESSGGVGVNLIGAIGLDYKFADIPLNLSLDWQPNFGFIRNGGFGYDNGGLAVRYTLGE